MRYYIDPPSGWKYGFPDIWDDEEETMDECLARHGYTHELPYIRMWKVEDESS